MATSLRTDRITRLALRNAIFTICGSANPSRGHLNRIGAEAALVAHRSRPWSGAWLYTLLNLDRYDHHNKGRVKYGISTDLFAAVMQLARRESLNGKHSVSIYADQDVRAGALVLGDCHRCARYRCGVWFISDNPRRLYCSDACRHRIELFRRKAKKHKAH